MSPGALSYVARYARGPLMRSQPDQRLVALVEASSEPAFEALVARYREPLLRYCRRILSGDRAEDAVQQTFVNAHAAILAGRGGADVRPWLYRIAHNVAIDQLRQRADAELSDDLPGGDLPDDIFSRRERFAGVVAALDDLPPRQRDALVLRELEGRSYDEIAVAMGVGDGAVRQLLNRARNTVRQAAAALVPPGVLRWAPDHVGRTAEVAGGAGATTVAVKSWLGGLLAAASIGGVAAVPIVSDGGQVNDQPAQAAEPREQAPASEASLAAQPTVAVERASAATPAAAPQQAPRSHARETAPAEQPAAPKSPDAHPRDHAMPPRHADENDDAENDDVEHADEHGDEPADDGTRDGNEGPDEGDQPSVDNKGHGGDDASDQGDDDPPEIEADVEDPPEEEPADDS
jgi:RNA polymerase sigma factor (sigma-70 family)